MQQNFIETCGVQPVYLVGDAAVIQAMPQVPVMMPFSEQILDFLQTLSRMLLSDSAAKAYPDVVTLGFWLRRGSMDALRRRFASDNLRVGRGVAFHIAPSNVPVNFAYSLVAGLLFGNANIVRVPTKDFPQVTMICRHINAALEQHPDMKPYIALLRYGHEAALNAALSGMADVRILWGGDRTVTELRQYPMQPRAVELTFADRYSLAVIDSDAFLASEQKNTLIKGFYNDTYLTDQNACTAPRLVAWTGSQKQAAKALFWGMLHDLVQQQYPLQDERAVGKLDSLYLLAAQRPCRLVAMPDLYIVRMEVETADAELMEYKDNSGFFFEYDCGDIMELRAVCNNTRCQTIGYFGEKEMLLPLLQSGLRGVDRVVPIGKTMDFDLIWDGYDLAAYLSRSVAMV